MKRSLEVLRVLGFATIALIFGAGCQETSEPITDAPALAAALEGAASGDEVRLGACHIVGDFVVPAGVSLVGAGVDQSVIESDSRAAVWVIGDIGMPTISDLSIVSNGAAGLVVAGDGGAGSVSLERIDIEVHRGVGIGVEQLGSISLQDVVTHGPITADNVDSLPENPSPTDTATHGIVMREVDDAQLTDVESTGFALFGAMAVDSSVTWRGGGVPGNHGTALLVEGGSATLETLDLCGTLKGELRGYNVYGAVFSDGAAVESDGLEVCDTDGFGILHHASSGIHVDLNAHDNNAAAVWAQQSSLEISGSTSSIVNNRLAGVALLDMETATIADAEISSTSSSVRVIGETGHCESGDGVQLVDTTGEVLLQNLTLEQNDRVGILLDLEEAPASLVLQSITVDGVEEQLGAIAQGSAVPDGWDEQVTRSGATEVNDDDFQGTMEVQPTIDMVDIPPGVACVIGDIGSCLVAQ